MKTALTILIVLMSFMSIWTVCQKDLINAVLAFGSLPFLIIGLVHPKINEKL